MRNKGNGLKIHKAIDRYRKGKEAESTQAWEKAHPPK
jgi:hypothetical protein